MNVLCMYDIINCSEFDICCDVDGIMITPHHKKRHTCISNNYFLSPWELYRVGLAATPSAGVMDDMGEYRLFPSCLLGWVDDYVYMVSPHHSAYTNDSVILFFATADTVNMLNWFVYQPVTR